MNAQRPAVLVIEDEAPIRKFLAAALDAEKFSIREAATGESGLRAAVQDPPDLVILDLGLPDLDGSIVLARLREWYAGPIIILSARDQEKQKVAALDAGADDYLTKPFSAPELAARMRVLLRRAARDATASGDATLKAGDIVIDLQAREVFVSGQLARLTPIEYKLLTTMLRHAGKALTHRFLLREVWGPNQSVEPHNLRVLMASLRRKVEQDPSRPQTLLTEMGVGYRVRA